MYQKQNHLHLPKFTFDPNLFDPNLFDPNLFDPNLFDPNLSALSKCVSCDPKNQNQKSLMGDSPCAKRKCSSPTPKNFAPHPVWNTTFFFIVGFRF